MSREALRFTAVCRCGLVEVEALGPHIAHLSCYCDDCQAAADLIDALPNGESGRSDDGGTENVLFRKDRVRCVRGHEHLIAYKVREDSFTNRMVASCCNSAMFQIHDNWFPHRGVKTQRFAGSAPPLEMRLFTRYAKDPDRIPRDVTRSRSVPAVFLFRALRALLELRFKPYR